jgi:hypothetical protein
MSEGRTGLAAWLLAQGGHAAARLLSSGPGQEAAARAVGAAQRGLQALAAVNLKAMQVAGMASKPDYDGLRKQLARIKRKVRDLEKTGGPGPRRDR